MIELFETLEPGSVTLSALRSQLGRNKELIGRDKRLFEQKIRHLLSGLDLLRKLQKAKNGKHLKKLPRESSWRKLVSQNPKEQAQWYLKHCPARGTPEFNMFKRLCKAFGLGGNEFYYWLRKLG